MIKFYESESRKANSQEYVGNSSLYICGAFLAGSSISTNNPSVSSFYSSLDDGENDRY